jgi:hypothetical protein
MLKSVRRAAGPEYANDIEWSKVKKIIQERRGYPIKVLDKKG